MKKSGFTLTEMLVALSIFAIVLAIGAPSFNAFVSNGNMTSNANGMIVAFNYARSEAINRSNTVSLSQVVAGSWTSGVVVWVDTNTDNKRGSGEELRLWQPFDDASAVNSANSRTNFIFSANGTVNNNDVLTICDDRVGETGMRISVLVSGAINSERWPCV